MRLSVPFQLTDLTFSKENASKLYDERKLTCWAMAQLQPSHTTISRRLSTEPICGFGVCRRGGKITTRVEFARSSKAMCGRKRAVRATNVSSSEQKRGMLEKFDDQTAANRQDFEVDIGEEAKDEGLEYVVQEYGWKVRRMLGEKSEIRKVAQIQAEAFHVPVALFNDLFFQLFQAEVLSGLLYRLRNSPPDSYACLVAEPADKTSKQAENKLVGVADLTVLRDSDVLQHLDGAKQYLYVSGIAVSRNHRRNKVATALLNACEVLSVLWGYEYLVLRAYDDDWGARALYTNAGYRVVSGDSPWLTWVGRKRRILMIKRSAINVPL